MQVCSFWPSLLTCDLYITLHSFPDGLRFTASPPLHQPSLTRSYSLFLYICSQQCTPLLTGRFISFKEQFRLHTFSSKSSPTPHTSEITASSEMPLHLLSLPFFHSLMSDLSILYSYSSSHVCIVSPSTCSTQVTGVQLLAHSMCLIIFKMLIGIYWVLPYAF